LAPGEEQRGHFAGGAGRDGHDGQARLGLVDVGGGDVARDGGEGLPVAGDEGGHPVLVGEADPAAFLDLHDLGLRAFALDEVQIGDIVVADFVELTIDLPDHALVQDEEVLKIVGQAVARDDPVGGEANLGVGGVFDLLRDAEHELVVHRDGAAEDQPVAIVPDQRDGAADAERLPAFQLPGRVRAGHLFEVELTRRGPAVERVIGFRPAGGREEAHDGRILFQRLVVFAQGQVVDPAASERNRAGEFRGLDRDARGLVQRDLGHLGVGHGRGRGAGARRWRGQGDVLAGSGFGGLRRLGQRGVGVNGGLRRREQDEPHEDDHHAERRGQDQITVLVVHDGPMSSGPKS
jgi:hypothetical protein